MTVVAAVLKEKGSDVVTVQPSATVQEIANIITSRRIGAVMVLSEPGKMVGIVSERDVVKAIGGHGDAALRLTAGDIMTRNVITASPRTTIEEAMELMDTGYFRHLPVLDEGAMVGIISVRDVVRAHIREQAHEVESLKSYVYRGAQADGLR
jgi:CBS domain-containing protein